MTVRMLGVSGSLRRDSYHTSLLRAAANAAPEGVELETFNALETIPPYHEDLDLGSGPEVVRAWRERLAAADAVLFATPEYNGSVPGQLKNALDWASRPFPDNVLFGKPVGVIGASTGHFGALAAQAELRRVLGVIGARVTVTELALPRAHEAFASDGHLNEPRLERRLHDVLRGLAQAVVGNAVRAA